MEDPWGTPQVVVVGYERKERSLTRCVLPERNEWIQSRALFRIPVSWSLRARVRCETVLKAAERSRRMRGSLSSVEERADVVCRGKKGSFGAVILPEA